MLRLWGNSLMTSNSTCLSDLAPSPKWLLDLFIHFFDPCPANHSYDGLKMNWTKHNYCNPPYSDKIPWIKKAIEEQKKGNMTVMLLPAATDAAWYHDLVLPNAIVLSFRGRLQLDNGKHPRYGSMLVVFP